MDVDAVKARVRRVWDMGDYSYLSMRLEPASRELCDACAVSAGQEVLDVAAGDGNFALACAREGASVVASAGRVARRRVARSNGSRPMPRSCPSRRADSTAPGRFSA